jgi:hypothetical protein
MKQTPMADAVSVKISKRNYRRVRRTCKQGGHSISWLLNYVLDLHYQQQADALALKKQFDNGAPNE